MSFRIAKYSAAIVAGFVLSMAQQAVAQDSAPVATHTAVIKTSMGNIEIELYGQDSPNTVKNFVGLAKKGYYNGILFHRVVPGFVIQAGDPFSRDSATNRAIWGTGGTSLYGSTFPDELNPNTAASKLGYDAGVLAMANRGPNTNSSQFFIVTDAAVKSRLPLKYTIFGKVTKGMDVVHKIENTPSTSQYKGQPDTPISIVSINAVEVKPVNH